MLEIFKWLYFAEEFGNLTEWEFICYCFPPYRECGICMYTYAGM